MEPLATLRFDCESEEVALEVISATDISRRIRVNRTILVFTPYLSFEGKLLMNGSGTVQPFELLSNDNQHVFVVLNFW